ncbi:MAG: hypothetical protein A2X12_03435 [Bacteroidetes bacterium GWE2_29_8]|nr:MAG: hypothetical protein A2X12_03435 [Bacteroidetes bacterium GWE2_29_8]OFY17389.1 MAG: hypothetical protein A2X02_00645 [Bacteroidetes bacterium GWF2_29_10]
MTTEKHQYSKQVEQEVLNLRKNIDNHNFQFRGALRQFVNKEQSNKRLDFIKSKSIDDLDRNIADFEVNFINRGGKIAWINSNEDFTLELNKIIKQHVSKKIAKHKSNIIKEFSYAEELFERVSNVSISEIVSDKLSNHLVNPLIEADTKNIHSFLNDKYHIPLTVTENEVSEFLRTEINKIIDNTDISISEADFLFADNGSIIISENDGDIGLSISKHKIHIVIAGIDNIFPTIKESEFLLSMLSTYRYGRKVNTSNFIISGVKQPEESEGIDELYLFLVNNYRTELLAKPEQKKVLNCIKCGICQNVCPVYKTIGDSKYNAIQTGPIGLLTTPYLDKEKTSILYLCSLCGKCSNICPAGINIPKLILYDRRDFSNLPEYSRIRTAIKIYRATYLNNWVKNYCPNRIKKWIKDLLLKKMMRSPNLNDYNNIKLPKKNFNQIVGKRM